MTSRAATAWVAPSGYIQGVSSEPVAGAVVGEHQLVRPIGQGGMGQVWEARHLPTGARRALKLLPRGADPELRLRFQREAEAQARVEGHPHLARIHASGVTAAGDCWLAMDLLPGGDLAARLRGGALPPAEAAAIVAALAGALAHVHARGVLHRDLKPGNVLFDDRGRPVLTDFGLAHAAGETRLTATGALLGTPAYAAPEQLVHAREAGPAADVYGLGAVLYHLLTGQPPFPRSTPTAVMLAAVSDPPPPLRGLAPAVPPGLERLCLRCLEKDPSRRPTAAELAAALEASAGPGAPAAALPWRALVGLGAALAAVALASRFLAAPAPASPATPASSVTATPATPAPAPPAPPTPAPLARAPVRLVVAALAPTSSRVRDLGALGLMEPVSTGLDLDQLIERARLGDLAAALKLGGELELLDKRELAACCYRQVALGPDPPPLAVSRWGLWLTGRALPAWQQEGLALIRAAAAHPAADWQVRFDLVQALMARLLTPEHLAEAVALLEAEVRSGNLEAEPWLGAALLLGRRGAPGATASSPELARARALLEAWRVRLGDSARYDSRLFRLLAVLWLDPCAGPPDASRALEPLRVGLQAQDAAIIYELVRLTCDQLVPDGLILELAPEVRRVLESRSGPGSGEDDRYLQQLCCLLLAGWAHAGRLPGEDLDAHLRALAELEPLLPDLPPAARQAEWRRRKLLPAAPDEPR